jgi:hypothetical protein
MMFDRLGESSMTQATLRMQKYPSQGYDRATPTIVKGLAGFLGRGGIAVGSFGQANVPGCLDAATKAARDAGLSGIKFGAMHGGDVLPALLDQNVDLPEVDSRIGDLGDRLICAHAYIGCEGFIELLNEGARFVLSGRIADASMAVATAYHSMGWDEITPERSGLGTMAGHMLQGGSSITGGGFADPPYRVVPGLDMLGFPYVMLSDDKVRVTKLANAGGMVTPETVKCRIGYEIHDPSCYLTPDVSLDMSMIEVSAPAKDVVELTGFKGNPRPEKLRALVGVRDGFKALAEGSMGGGGCLDRAQLAEDLIRERLKPWKDDILSLRFDIHGISTLFGKLQDPPPALNEVRFRVAAHCRTRDAARAVCFETGMVYFDRPAGVGGPQASVVEALTVIGVPVERSAVTIRNEVVTL